MNSRNCPIERLPPAVKLPPYQSTAIKLRPIKNCSSGYNKPDTRVCRRLRLTYCLLTWLKFSISARSCVYARTVLAAQSASCARAEILPKDSWTFSKRACIRFWRTNVARITSSKGAEASKVSRHESLARSGKMTRRVATVFTEYMKASVLALTAALISLVARAISSPVRFLWKNSNGSF